MKLWAQTCLFQEEQKSKDRMEKREHDKAAASEAKKDPDTTIQNAFEKSECETPIPLKPPLF